MCFWGCLWFLVLFIVFINFLKIKQSTFKIFFLLLLLPIFLQDHNYTYIRSCEAIPQLSGGLIFFFLFHFKYVYFYVYQFTKLLTPYLSFLTFQFHFLNSKHLLDFALGSPSSTASWKHSTCKLLHRRTRFTCHHQSLWWCCPALHKAQWWKQPLHILSSFLFVFGARVNTLTGSGSTILNPLNVNKQVG